MVFQPTGLALLISRPSRGATAGVNAICSVTRQLSSSGARISAARCAIEPSPSAARFGAIASSGNLKQTRIATRRAPAPRRNDSMPIAASRRRRTSRLRQPAGHREISPPISARSARSHLRSWHPANAARLLRRKGRQCPVAESDVVNPWRRIPARRHRMRNPAQRPESTSASTIQWPVTRNPRSRDRMECSRQGWKRSVTAPDARDEIGALAAGQEMALEAEFRRRRQTTAGHFDGLPHREGDQRIRALRPQLVQQRRQR